MFRQDGRQLYQVLYEGVQSRIGIPDNLQQIALLPEMNVKGANVDYKGGNYYTDGDDYGVDYVDS